MLIYQESLFVLIPLLVVSINLLAVGAAASHFTTGVFYVPRQARDFCSYVTAQTTIARTSRRSSDVGGAILSVAWSDLDTQLQHVATYVTNTVGSSTDDGNWTVIDLEIAALLINSTGEWASTTTPTTNISSFDYQCPPSGYNGYGGGCQTPAGTQLWAVHRRQDNGYITRIDIVRSGAPFPPVAQLKNNLPPFGVVRFSFEETGGVPTPGTSSLNKDKKNSKSSFASSDGVFLEVIQRNPVPAIMTERLCPSAATFPALSLAGLQFSGYGFFSPDAGKTMMRSNWHMDDPRQLMVIEPYPSQYWFNASGFFATMQQASGEVCAWVSRCDYQCEVYNYDSRFLDDLGEFLLLDKLAIQNFTAGQKVQVFMGNAIDAAGVFPCLLYMDATTEKKATNDNNNSGAGLYRGLDKWDTTPLNAPNAAFYWYDRTVRGPPVFSELPWPESCGSSEKQWSGGG